jgi:hypothetical protein
MKVYFFSFLVFTSAIISYSMPLGFVGAGITFIVLMSSIWIYKDKILILISNKKSLIILTIISGVISLFFLILIFLTSYNIGNLQQSVSNIGNFKKLQDNIENIHFLYNFRAIFRLHLLLSVIFCISLLIRLYNITSNRKKIDMLP